jgi:ketosteroid isomerase-like protein
MSEENVALVRELTEMFQRRQHERALEYYDEDVLFDSTKSPVPLVAGVYHGREGVQAYWREWLSAWSDLQFDIQDVVAGEGGKAVLLVANQRAWGKHSGIETTFPAYGIVFEIRDGKVVHWCAYPDQPSALEAAGADPPPG